MSFHGYIFRYIKENHRRFHFFFVLIISTAISFGFLSVSLFSSAQSNRCISNNFNNDPGWIGENNLPEPGECRQVVQDYGYSSSNFAGGSPGELGGLFSRTLTRSYYGDSSIGNLDFNDHIRFSGKFSITRGDDGYAFLGFFNNQEQGWRPPNFLGFHVGADRGVIELLPDYTSSQWGAGGFPIENVGPSNGAVHTFTFNYNPSVGNGLITFTLDGVQYQLVLSAEHRAQGANFNRFGVFHLARTAGASVNVYFDDLRYTTSSGEKYESFNSNPGWDARANRSDFLDCETQANQNFGYRGGNIGGLFHRIDADTTPVYYADDLPTLTQNDYLEARGSLIMTMGNADSGMQIGWFNNQFEGTPGGSIAFVGAAIEGPSAVGHYFGAVVKSIGGEFNHWDNQSTPVILPNSVVRQWRIIYDPNGSGGQGSITISVDGQTQTSTLPPGVKARGFNLNRFGIYPFRNSGSSLRIFFDNILYTAVPGQIACEAPPVPTPTPTPVPTATPIVTPIPTPRPTVTLRPTATPTSTIIPTPLPSRSVPPRPAATSFEEFNLWNLPLILSRLSCYFVQFAIVLFGVWLLYCGIKLLLSRGNQVAYGEAKKTFTYTILGGLIIYGVYTIILSILAFFGVTDLSWIPLSCS